MWKRVLIGFIAVSLSALPLVGCSQGKPVNPSPPNPNSANPTQPVPNTQKVQLPRPDHVVIVIEENRSYEQIIESQHAPYLNELVRRGALFSDSHGVVHPSQANYIALLSGSTQGVTSDACPHTFSAPNLASSLLDHGFTFGGYSETMPTVGFTGCSHGAYERKHNPWVNFSNVPAPLNMPLTSFPLDYTKLPTVSFVVPNQDNDMHDGTVERADRWLKEHLDGYLQWAESHNSLMIVTWDEDDFTAANRIPTIFVGPMVKPGVYDQKITHYSVLRTLEDLYGLPHHGETTAIIPINGVWR